MKKTETSIAGPLLVTAEGVAKLLQVSKRTLWRLLSMGQLLPPVRLGGSVRWRLDEIKQWIEAGCPAVAKYDKKGT